MSSKAVRLLIGAGFSLTSVMVPARAAEQFSAQQAVNDLTKRILSKQLIIERLTTEFRLRTSLVSIWRQRRMFTYAETNALCTEAGLIESLVVRSKLARQKVPKGAKGLDTEQDLPDQQEYDNLLAGLSLTPSEESAQAAQVREKQAGRDRGRLSTATTVQLVGQSAAIAGDFIELGLNFSNYLQIKKDQLTPAIYRHRLQALHTELDHLIEERLEILAHAQVTHTLVGEGQIQSELSSSDIAIATAESKILKDLRDFSLIEYKEAHAATKRFWVLQNTAFLVDLLKNGTGAAGNVVGLSGNHLRLPRLQGTAGILSTTSGVIVLLTPIVGRVTGNVAGLAARRLVSKELKEVDASDSVAFKADRSKLTSLLTSSTTPQTSLASGAQSRQAIYERDQKMLEDLEKFDINQRKRAKSTLKENLLFAAAVGPPRIANGITGIVGGFKYYSDPPVANKLYLGGTIAYTSAGLINILETARVQAAAEVRNREQKHKRSTTKQRFSDKLKQLDGLQEKLSLDR